MATPVLLQTKFLIPRASEAHVLRSHLVEEVASSLDQKLVVISAPPGYGKTMLMVDVVKHINLPVLWYQLDEGDNDPATFIAYILEGLKNIVPDVARAVQHLLFSGESMPPERLLVLLINELLETDTAWLLVLDDYHVVTNPTIHQLTAALLEHRLQHMKVILSSRTVPQLPLHRWRARNQVKEIRAEQLRFSASETADWLRQTQVPTTVARDLVEKTEGWCAGLQLAISLLGESTPQDFEDVVSNLGGTHPYIFNYLMEEIFEKQPPFIQDFLLQSALCVQLNDTICRDALHIDNAGQILESLLRNNLFLIRLDNHWYRYHQLFQEFLRDRLLRENPAQARDLSLQLGNYHYQKKDYETAVQYFLRAGDRARASEVLQTFAFLYIEQGRVDSLHHYLQQIDDLQQNAQLLHILGHVERHQGKLSMAMLHFEMAYRLADSDELAVSSLTQLAGIARSRGDYLTAQQLARQATGRGAHAPLHTRALALMEQAKSEGFLAGMATGYDIARQAIAEMEQASTQFTPYQLAHLRLSFGQICWWYGDVTGAIEQGEFARSYLSDNPSPLVAMILHTLAIPYLYQHDYQKALDYAERSLEICQSLNLQEQLPTAYAVLGNVLTRVGQLTQAENCLRQAIEIASELHAASYAQIMAEGYLAYNLVAQGRVDEAQQIAETALFPHAGQTIVYEIYVCKSVLADTCLEKMQVQQACDIFEELVSIGEQRQYRIPLAMAYFGLAYFYLSRHLEDEQGLQYARKSLELLSPTGAWELYVDQGQRARVVCDRLAADIPGNLFLRRVLQEINQHNQTRIEAVPVNMQIYVQTFGGFRVRRGDTEISASAWVSIKARELLAYFVTFRHERVTLDRILDSVWENGERGTKVAFHTALYRLRQALRHDDEKLKFILVESGDYRLDTARFEIDADEFETLIRRADENAEMALYQEAIDLYKGKYLVNFYHDWALGESERLSQLYLYALERLRRFHAKAGRYDPALQLARKALKENRFLEDIHCEVMEYLHHLGDRQGIIQQYQTLREMLHEEINVEPLPTTDTLFQRLIGSP